VVPRLILGFLSLAAILSAAACGAPEVTEQETAQSTAAAKEAGSRWSEADREKLSNAMNNARSDDQAGQAVNPSSEARK
jgi:uncharacterized membrane protein